MNPQAIKSLRIRNFKAIRDSGDIEFTPFTVLIGNNGSGKSSLIEALETFQTIVERGLDEAMNRWRGIENIRNRAVPPVGEEPDEEVSDIEEPPDETDFAAQFGQASEEKPLDLGREKAPNPVEFYLSRELADGVMDYRLMINSNLNADELFIQHEQLRWNNDPVLYRSEDGSGQILFGKDPFLSLMDGESILSSMRVDPNQIRYFNMLVSRWQFALLNPDAMVNPIARTRTNKQVQLARNGSNIAEYLLDIRKYDQKYETTVLDDIIETLKYVLPYAEDLQPNVTSELERSAYLQLTEGGYKVPGWLLSSGTLRIVALLALLRHPQPPPLIVIEEIENGLDPRTINLIVQEIMEVTESGKCQVIVTTHSPYLLDLIPLENIIVVERIDGQPTFFRPSDDESMRKWSESFTPGALYTMSQLTRRSE